MLYYIQIISPFEQTIEGKRADIEFEIEYSNIHEKNKLLISVLGDISFDHSN